MKNIVILILMGAFLMSCGETESKESEVKINESNGEASYVDLSIFSEKELKTRVFSLEKQMLDSATLETNRENSIKLLEAANNFAERFPESPDRETILYKGSLAARGLDKAHEATRILDVLMRDYKTSERYPEYVYEKAFICDEQLQNKEQAKRLYQELAKDFPNHLYGQQSKERLETIDMTDEQLIEYFKKKNAQS